MKVPDGISDFFRRNQELFPDSELDLCKKYVERLFDKTLIPQQDGTIHVITGDIPAMWIRDSTWQLLPLLDLEPTREVCEVVGAVSRRQARFLEIDPYANAFNETANGNCWHKDFKDQSDWVFERKFELDSWSTFLELALSLFEQTGFSEHLDERFWNVAQTIVSLSLIEQHHDPTTYRFVRESSPAWDQLPNGGFGADVAFTGLVWSAFRPSDDRCVYGYHIPSNAHLSSVLQRLIPAAKQFGQPLIIEGATKLVGDINSAIEAAIHMNDLLPYEIDGFENAIYMDDPNVPSLLSLPFLGWTQASQPAYQSTRKWLFSSHHEYFFQTDEREGFASEHTPVGYVWPLSIAMRGLTALHLAEAEDCIRMLMSSDGETGDMHESFNIHDPRQFTRPWFSWADMLFVQLVVRSRCS